MPTAYLRVTAIPLTFYAARAGTRVAVLFSAEEGQIRVGVRGSTRKGSSGNLPIALLSTYELLLEKRARGGELFDLKETEEVVRRPNLGSGKPLLGWAAASVLSELLLKTTEPYNSQPYLFAMLGKALDLLEADQEPAPLVISYFLKYLEHMGLGFRFESLPSGHPSGNSIWLDVAHGEFMQANPGHSRSGVDLSHETPEVRPVRVSAETVTALQNFRVAVFERLGETPLKPGVAEEAIRLLETWLEHHLDTRLKSFTFWRDVNDRERNRK